MNCHRPCQTWLDLLKPEISLKVIITEVIWTLRCFIQVGQIWCSCTVFNLKSAASRLSNILPISFQRLSCSTFSCTFVLKNGLFYIVQHFLTLHDQGRETIHIQTTCNSRLCKHLSLASLMQIIIILVHFSTIIIFKSRLLFRWNMVFLFR